MPASDNPQVDQLSKAARSAMTRGDWNQVHACAADLFRMAPNSPEGPFLFGMVQKAANGIEPAAKYFRRALDLDSSRYDAAIELAGMCTLLNRYGEARELLDNYRGFLDRSPVYLDMAGQLYSRMSLHADAYALFKKAIALQPKAEQFQANLAACAVYLGKIDESRDIYTKLLKRNPAHQRNHYELAQLQRAKDDRHVKQMEYVLSKASPDPTKNIFLYYALGKEYEDLEQWDKAFHYIKKAGDAVTSMANYDVSTDVRVMDEIREVCNAEWLSEPIETDKSDHTPIFVVGLPRTGTTLTDRILSCHSQVQSIGETQLLQMVVKSSSGIKGVQGLTPEMIAAAAKADAAGIGRAYVDAIAYRLGAEPWFVDKLPENVLFAGFIAKAWPDTRIVHLRRHPMDACFAMYKQSYFRFAYSLDDLAEYYLAYDRLTRHWRDVLGDRVVEVEYEKLVSDLEGETSRLLDALGLEFEEACLDFQRNTASVATASSAQVREKVHTLSVGKWKKFASHLEPLRMRLEEAGVGI